MEYAQVKHNFDLEAAARSRYIDSLKVHFAEFFFFCTHTNMHILYLSSRLVIDALIFCFWFFIWIYVYIFIYDIHSYRCRMSFLLERRLFPIFEVRTTFIERREKVLKIIYALKRIVWRRLLLRHAISDTLILSSCRLLICFLHFMLIFFDLASKSIQSIACCAKMDDLFLCCYHVCCCFCRHSYSPLIGLWL